MRLAVRLAPLALVVAFAAAAGVPLLWKRDERGGKR